MKRFFSFLAGICFFTLIASADDRPVTYEQLPAPAKTFINEYYSGVKVSFVSKDDDFVRPDYSVMLSNGVKLEFRSSGALKSVSCSKGIDASIIPEPIRDYVNLHYPGTGYVEYEVGRRTYEVVLANRLELKFNSNFNLIELDD